jgi:hypothetical protein
MNEGSLIAPISSLHRYLTEANDSILSQLNNDGASDLAGANSETNSDNMGELRNSHVTTTANNKQQ